MFKSLSIIFLLSAFAIETKCESPEVLKCADNLNSVEPSKLCDYNADCQDASDELNFDLCKKLVAHRKLCPTSSSSYHYNYNYETNYENRNNVRCVSNGKFNYLNDKCLDIITACSLGIKCLSNSDISICEEIPNKKLKHPLFTSERANEVEINKLMQLIINETLAKDENQCPTFFTPLNDDKCISLLAPAKVSWKDGQIFCESITSNLGVIDNVNLFVQVLEYLRKENVSFSFWIGGYSNPVTEPTEDNPHIHSTSFKESLFINPKKKFFDEEIQDLDSKSQNWTWLNGDSVMMGTPFWALYSDDSNIYRYNGNITTPLKLMPRYQNEKTCLAILSQNYYYFSDEFCNKKFAPLCIRPKL